MIYTLTLNPALDYTLNVNRLKYSDINISPTQELNCGGKGINVSLMLKNLKAESTALGFIAGFTGDELEKRLGEAGLKTNFLRLGGGLTRINVKIRDGAETDINCDGPFISENDIIRLENKVKSVIKSGDVLCLSGSLPRSVPEDVYARIIEAVSDSGVKITVDTTGKALLNTLPFSPFLIKPNLKELGDLFSVSLSNETDAVLYAERLVEMGAENVLVSMGKDGSVLVSRDCALRAYAPEGKVVNTVAAGDSTVAGFIAGMLSSADKKSALALATACGSATAFSSSIGTKESVMKLVDLVRINKI